MSTVWWSKDLLPQVVSAGYQAILSMPEWYLDHLENTWDRVYDEEPYERITDADHQKLVLGGQVCM